MKQRRLLGAWRRALGRGAKSGGAPPAAGGEPTPIYVSARVLAGIIALVVVVVALFLYAAPTVPVVALGGMALAIVLSLCSESDAFVAASFVQFGVGAQLAFLVFGPMVDTKLGFLYTATFSRGFFPVVVVTVAAVTLVGALWIEVLIG